MKRLLPRVLRTPEPLCARPIAGRLPFGDLSRDARHILLELAEGQDMSVEQERVVVGECHGKMVVAEPFAMILGKVVGMVPVAAGVALSAAGREPPITTIFDIDSPKSVDILLEHIMLVAIDEHGDESFRVAV